MKYFILILFITYSSSFLYGQEITKSVFTKAFIDSIASIDDKNLAVTLACGPSISKRSAYTSFDSDTLVYASGFIYNPLTNTESNWHFSYYENKLIRATVWLNHLHKEPLYKATYYFGNNGVVFAEGENVKYSNTENILESAAKRFWQALATK